MRIESEFALTGYVDARRFLSGVRKQNDAHIARVTDQPLAPLDSSVRLYGLRP